MAYHGSAYLWRVVIKSTAFNSTGAVWLGATHYPRLIGRRVAIVAVATRVAWKRIYWRGLTLKSASLRHQASLTQFAREQNNPAAFTSMAAASTAEAASTAAPNEAATKAAAEAAEQARLDKLSEPLSLVAFDFDLTVLRIHSWGSKIEASGVEKRRWQDDFEDLELFRAVCRGLVKRGVRVAIASFGSREVITKYLDLAFGADRKDIFPDNCISTPSSVGMTDGCSVEGGKNPQLAKLRRDLGIQDRDPASVLFFEDDFANCRLATKVGVVPFHCPKHFLRASWDAAADGYLKVYAPKVLAKSGLAAAAGDAPAVATE